MAVVTVDFFLECVKDLKSFFADCFDQHGREISALKTAVQQQGKEMGDLRRQVAALCAARAEDLVVQDAMTPSTEPATPQVATPRKAEDSSVDVNGVIRRAVYAAVAKDSDPKRVNRVLRQAIYARVAEECRQEITNAPDAEVVVGQDACVMPEDPEAIKEPASSDNQWGVQEWPVADEEIWWKAKSTFDIRRSCERYSREDATGETLKAGEWVKVTHRIRGAGGSDFLKLEDGRGYVFIKSRAGFELFEAHAASGLNSELKSRGWKSWSAEQSDRASKNTSAHWNNDEPKSRGWKSWNAEQSGRTSKNTSTHWNNDEPKSRGWKSWNAEQSDRAWSNSSASSASNGQQRKEDQEKVYMTEADWAAHFAAYEAWQKQKENQ